MENQDADHQRLESSEDYDDIQEEESRRSGYTVFSGFQTVLSIAIVMATILTLWNPRKFLGTPNLSALIRAESSREDQTLFSEEESTLDHIGILSGHWMDLPGEVCQDGTVEAEINLSIANQTAELLRERGLKVDVFPEYDIALLNYQSSVFIAIYSGSCAEDPLPPSGFKVSTSLTAQNPELVNELAVCISEKYQEKTKLPFSYEVLNPDHPSYHIFRDIHSQTPAIIIEAGSLKTDRILLSSHSETVAEGIAAGILCFLEKTAATSD